MRVLWITLSAFMLLKGFSSPVAIGTLAASDPRNIATGLPIPAKHYCDQPYVVVTTNGEWVVVLTTGTGEEGSSGQHIASSRSTDQGRTWSPLVDIEPPDGPEASWAIPLITPYGRIYVFYTYNGDNITTLPGGANRIRSDTHGWYCFKYSDDNGQSWSADRYRIPVRITACDLANQWNGTLMLFWGIDKPKVWNGKVRFAFTKLGRFFLENGEGWLLESENLLTERDPNQLRFVTLPDGEHGIRHNAYGSVQEEHNLVPLAGDDIFCVYRLNEQTPMQSISRDGGRTWALPSRMTYGPGQRTIKQPRACPKLFKTSCGRFLFWYHNHSGKSFESRNPVFLTGGILHDDGYIHWAEPEIILFDTALSSRMSYPDLIEQGGRFWITETQKTIARSHELDISLLHGLWNQASNRNVCAEGLLATTAYESFGTLDGRGLSLELLFRLRSFEPGQTLFKKTDAVGKGVTVETIRAEDDSPALRITLSDGMNTSAWTSDPGKVSLARDQHIVFLCDFSARLITILLNGQLGDGDGVRQYGWGRLSPNLTAMAVTNLPVCHPSVLSYRLYNRALRTSEAMGNYQSLGLPPQPPTENSPRTLACWPLDTTNGVMDISCAINRSHSLSVNKKNPGMTNTHFNATIPNPDHTSWFTGDPRKNNGSVFFGTEHVGGYLTAPNLGNRVELNVPFTVEGWLCRTSDPTTSLWYVVGAREIAAGWMLTLRRTDNTIGYHLHVNGLGIDTFFPNGDVTQNPGWHHVALVYDPARNTTGAWELFINGTTAGVLTNNAYPPPHRIAAFNLGGRASIADNTFRGLFDYWRVSHGARHPKTFLNAPYPTGTSVRLLQSTPLATNPLL